MNKKFLVTFIIFIVVGTWFFSNEEDQVPSSVETEVMPSQNEVILPNIQTPEWDQFTSRLTQQLKDSEANAELLDFRLQADQISRNHNIETIKDGLLNVVASTLDCYKQDECGFEHPPEDEYNDPSEIPALKTLKRQFTLANELAIDIPIEQLLESIQLPNDDVREQAFSLLLKKKDSGGLGQLFDRIEALDGKSFGPMMKSLLKSSQAQPDAFDELFKRFVRTLEEKDPYTSIEALESFRGIQISQSQLEDLGATFCSWRQKADQNWLAAKKNLEEMASEQKLSFNSENLCR